ncbi:MAG: hypothetical protein ACREYF_06380 [Gammaproteobacteria bacterium]
MSDDGVVKLQDTSSGNAVTDHEAAERLNAPGERYFNSSNVDSTMSLKHVEASQTHYREARKAPSR